jgi:hypothetical protein
MFKALLGTTSPKAQTMFLWESPALLVEGCTSSTRKQARRPVRLTNRWGWQGFGCRRYQHGNDSFNPWNSNGCTTSIRRNHWWLWASSVGSPRCPAHILVAIQERSKEGSEGRVVAPATLCVETSLRHRRAVVASTVTAARRCPGADAWRIAASTVLVMAVRDGGGHRVAVALVPSVIRWGAGASSDVLRTHACCAVCRRRGASLQHPSWGDAVTGWEMFPVA